MSSVSGDESNETAGNDTVRRTRSGRAVKAVTTPTAANKKMPLKRTALVRNTRASKNLQENIEEESTTEPEPTVTSENGVQLESVGENKDTVIEQSNDEVQEQMETQVINPAESNEITDEQQSEELQQDNNYIDEPIEEAVEPMEEAGQIEETEPMEEAEEQIEEMEENMQEEASEEQATECQEQQPMIDQVNDNVAEENLNDNQEEMTEETDVPQEASSEDNIPEFDPEEVNREDVTQEEISQEERKVDETSTQMSADKETTQEASQINDNDDDQCIVIEDDIDPSYGLDEHIEESNDSTKVKAHHADDEVIEISDQENDIIGKKSVPGTEAVSEDELPTETAKEPETEAVSDDELPTTKIADLGETESVSDDELPVESEKKRKGKSQKTEKKAKPTATKRKRTAQGEYDPSSPTSENNDETPAKIKAISADDSSDKDAKPASPKKKTLPELEKYWKTVQDDPTDFTGWTYLLQYVDQENDAEAAREAYDKFLQRYPYCYGYWRKYADYEKKKGDPARVQTVFDQGLNAISLSVDLWLHYINHCKVAFEKDEDKMREQYERAIKACGLEFRSDRLWESYIKWELEHKRLNKIMAIYDRLLTTPTQGYMSHFESFQEFVTSNSPNKILSVDDFLELRAEVKSLLKAEDASASDDAPPGEELPPDEKPPSDEETRMIREKIISSRRKMHKSNVNAVAARWTFEEGIKRPYFHVKPLERCQLKNWKEYLDYEIEQKDHNRIVILFERCLIACALYDEFWMRFVRYLESQKGDNADKIRDVYRRACTVHHPKKPNLHLLWASFEEGMGNYVKAANILENIDNVTPNVLQIAYRRINLERRRGDLEKAASLYEHYIATSKNRTIANNIVVKYARFLCKVKNDIDKAIKVLIKATEKDKDNPRLYLQLVDLGLQRNPIDVQEVVGYMDLFIDREHTDVEQRLVFAQRKVEFLEDFGSDIRQVLKAHEQFQKCIKQAKERKKVKTEEKISEAPQPKKAKTDVSAVPAQPAAYQYSSTSAPYQSQQQFPSGQYPNQAGYQQGYQQYPPPSDPNYANYQNWQYSQGGPQAYPAYNQWGSYNYY